MESSTKSVIIGSCCFILMHVLVWTSTNLQFVRGISPRLSILVSVALSIPTTLLAYYGSKWIYSGVESSAWAVRFIGFGVSWLVFPLMTWILLKESPWSIKTGVCMALAIVIMLIQVLWRTGTGTS